MNGANVSPLGLRPFPGGPPGYLPLSGLREADDATAEKTSEPQSDSAATAGTREGLKAKSGDGPAVDPAKAARTSRPEPDEAAKVPPQRAVDTTAAALARATVEAKRTAKAPSEDGSAKAAPEPAAAKPMASGAPSDALVDAVVALVHKEPETLSVFTSGSAFIHGVTSQDHSKPGPNAARKLDRSASELLRPMLRQWLAENMPRIVEEALRSELMNSQTAPKDSDEA